MSVYHYVANKDEILDGIVDIVFSEIELPTRRRLARRDAAAGRLGPRGPARATRWAIGLLESRTSPGPATLRHHDAVIGTLRRRASRWS